MSRTLDVLFIKPGSQRVMEDVTKGYKLDQVLRVVEMTSAQDQHICANLIFGLPEDDYDSMQETNALMQEINAEWANIYSAMAYPGSKLYDDAVAANLPLPATWNGFSQYSRDCLPRPRNTCPAGRCWPPAITPLMPITRIRATSP
jgi:anaerobic magnesium-protoporphyrin IX monomethyl ester cyclase